MTTGQNELRMIWLMSLIIVGVGAWYLNQYFIGYLCGIGFLISVMQYVTAVQQPLEQLAAEKHIELPRHSKVPLYISSIVAIVGGIIDWSWLIGVGISAWIFFLLRWLQNIERSLVHVQRQHHYLVSANAQQVSNKSLENTVIQNSEEPSFIAQIQQWIFQGNPVLKAAIVILIVGVILLLRFASENWQLSLAVKLSLVAVAAIAVTGLGLSLSSKNRGFALALQGLGQGVLFLTLFFAYYNLVISSLAVAAVLFTLTMVVTLWLSFKQNSFELTVMAVLVAYLAPFTLPAREATAVEFIAYYLVVNIAIACISSLKPWKFLNQIAFLMTVLVGGGYAFLHGVTSERLPMTALVLGHSAVFIWLGFRFSQLLAKSDLTQFKLKPILDIGLIFAAPLSAYGFLYLIHFNKSGWQAGLSLLFAAIFAVCWLWSRRAALLNVIANSYLSLCLIFLVLIPPILIDAELSVMGWAFEGVLIYIWAHIKNVKVAHYLSLGLLVMAGLSSLYYLVEINPVPRHIYWGLSASYLIVVVFTALWQHSKQLNQFTTIVLSVFSFVASLILFALLEDEFSGNDAHTYSLLTVVLLFAVLNEWVIQKNKTWSWLIPKWTALTPLVFIALILAIDHSQNAVVQWETLQSRLAFAVATFALYFMWVRPDNSLKLSTEWVSLGALTSLSLASLTLLPQMPYMSLVILPLLLCLWSYRQSLDSLWRLIWQSSSTLLLMAVWLICSQLFSQQAFQFYVLPILNPFDLISLAMLVGFLWMLLQQIRAGKDSGFIAVLMVLSLLWLSSYIVLRALHYYLLTPFNEWALWSNATVQLSLTVLWVSLAFVTMWIAHLRQLKPMWVLGGSILVMVSLKLVLFDLANIGTLTRVISFLLAGGVMLVIAYIAPMPEKTD